MGQGQSGTSGGPGAAKAAAAREPERETEMARGNATDKVEVDPPRGNHTAICFRLPRDELHPSQVVVLS